MLFFMDSCTVYNKYMENGVEKYQRTVLGHVNWRFVEEMYPANNAWGFETADVLRIYVPFNVEPSREKRFYPLSLDDVLPEERKQGWTLKVGDWLVRGAVDYEIENSASELLDKFKEVIQLKYLVYNDAGGNIGYWKLG